MNSARPILAENRGARAVGAVGAPGAVSPGSAVTAGGAVTPGNAVNAPPIRRHASISIKTPDEVELMHSAGQVARAALRAAASACVPGSTTAGVDAAASGVIAAFRAEPLFLNYRVDDGPGFPAATCVSVNEEIVHGIPGARILRDGDVVSIDCGVRLRGWCADAATTVVVGTASAAVLEMVECAERILAEAIEMVRPGRAWSQIAARMQEIALAGHYGLVVDLMGHGIGRELHESPAAPNTTSRRLQEHDDFTLLPGMVLAIEPMLVLGGDIDHLIREASELDADGHPAGVETVTRPDGWTVATASGRPACHVEHTVAVTRTGARVLTGPVRPSVREEAAKLSR